MSEAWIRVCSTSELLPGEYKIAWDGDVAIAVFNIDGDLYAVEDVCTHDGGELAGGPVDGFVIDRLSLGGSLAFFTQSGDADGDGVLFSPRVGYAIPLSSVFTFWPRGGFTFLKLGEASLFGLTAEAMFVAQPKPNWGILFGPTFDLGFIGDAGNDVDWSHIAIGFPAVGLMATF